jgi:3-hydroxyacyl-CoA dehydrogenase/enoyl-CoA hydratase/3-hydroxybutyryl-CoA epimerase
VPVEAIDRALMAWGFPVGPLQLLDEVGIDVAAHVGESLVAAFGDRFRAPSVSARLQTSGRKGRKNGKGFYRYDDKAFRDGQRRVDESIYEDLGLEPRARVPVEEIQTRCALQFVNEAVACLGEGVLRSPRDGDVGAVLGLGFPAFRGGPFRYVDTVGAAEVLRRMQSYRDRFGRRFTAAPLLVEMARKGERFFP